MSRPKIGALLKVVNMPRLLYKMMTKSRLRLISERVPAWRRLLVRELHVDAAEGASLVGDPLHLEQMPIYSNKGVEVFLKPSHTGYALYHPCPFQLSMVGG